MAYTLRSALVALCTLLIFLGLHELGHVLAAYLTGGTVRDVVLFSLRPHVLILGPATATQEAIRTVGGSACSLLACFLWLFAGRLRTAYWQLSRDTASAFGCVELIGWSLSSIMHAQSPYPDDAERFLAVSGASPYSVVAVCIGVACAGLLLFLVNERKGRTFIVANQPTSITPLSNRVAARAAGRS